MSQLTTQQIQTLVGLIVTTQPDELSCEGCFGQIGEFAEKALEGRKLSAGMQTIQRHLQQCPCCAGEYEALLDALKEIEPV
jgi:hypothetical protein